MPSALKIASTLAGIGSAFGGSGPGPRQQAKGQLMGAFEAADKAGLHRLAVAGSPAGYSPVPSGQAEGLMRASETLRGLNQGKKSRAKEMELIDAQIEEARSRTALNEANARRAMSGPQPGLGGASPRLQRALEAFDQSYRGAGNRGVRVEPEGDLPATQTVTLGPYGGRGPFAEAFEVGISELIAGGLIYGPQWLAGAIKDMSSRARDAAPKVDEKGRRDAARERARTRERRAQESPYLFPRR